MGILERIRQNAKEPASRHITTIDDYASQLQDFLYHGLWYGGGVQQTLAGEPAEQIENSFEGYVRQIYKENGPVFALMATRMLAFSFVRFQWQLISNGRPNKLFGNESLSLLETPWVGGTTLDLLVKMISDVDLAGNFYGAKVGDELVRLRPDWVAIALEERIPDPRFPKQVLGFRKAGYVYQEGGFNSEYEPVVLLPHEVAHFAPYPDPEATYRGMSWLTPVIRSMSNDKLMERHQRKFFENGATPNMIVSLDASVTFDQFMKFKQEFNLEHRGVENAYKTLFFGGGADATVVGTNFEQMSFTAVQGRGETRLAAAAGVPVTIVGFSEGLQGSSLNAGNFAQARRRLADLTMHPLWANAAGSLQTLLQKPRDVSNIRLWYDSRDVPFLREDSKDQAEIMQIKAATLNALRNSGWTPDSALQAVLADDFSGLEDTGLLSVQLQAPGTVAGAEAPATENEGGNDA